MRLVVSLEDAQQAEKFSLFLLERGIENQVEAKTQNQNLIWVLDEDNIPKAQSCLKEFAKSPQWVPSPSLVRKKREEELQKEAERFLAQNPNPLSGEEPNQNPLEDLPQEDSSNSPQVNVRKGRSMGKLTLFITCSCILLYLWAFIGSPTKIELPSGESFTSSYLFTTPYNQLIYESPLAYQYASKFLENLRQSGNSEEYIKGDAAYEDMHQFQTSPYWHGFYETYFVPDTAATYSLNKSFAQNPQFEQIAQGEI